MHEILGANIADGSWGERAAAEPADRAFEMADAAIEARQRIGDANAAGVVQMQAQYDVGEVLLQIPDGTTDTLGVRDTGGVGEINDRCIVIKKLRGHFVHGLPRYLALIGT